MKTGMYPYAASCGLRLLLIIAVMLFTITRRTMAQILDPVKKTFYTHMTDQYGPTEITVTPMERKVFFSEFEFDNSSYSWGTGFEVMISKDIALEEFEDLSVQFLYSTHLSGVATLTLNYASSFSLVTLLDASSESGFAEGVIASETEQYRVLWVPEELWNINSIAADDSPVRGLCIVRSNFSEEGLQLASTVRDFVMLKVATNPSYILPELTGEIGTAGMEFYSSVGVNFLPSSVTALNGNFQLRDWGWDHVQSLATPPTGEHFASWTATSPGAINSHFTPRPILYSATYFDEDIGGSGGLLVQFFMRGKDSPFEGDGEFSQQASQGQLCARDLLTINYADSDEDCDVLAYPMSYLYEEIQQDCLAEQDLNTIRHATESSINFAKTQLSSISSFSCNGQYAYHSLKLYYDPLQSLAYSAAALGTNNVNMAGYLPGNDRQKFFFTTAHEIGHLILFEDFGIRSHYGFQEGLADCFAIATFNEQYGCESEDCFHMAFRRYDDMKQVFHPFESGIVKNLAPSQPGSDTHQSGRIIPRWWQLLSFGGVGSYEQSVYRPDAQYSYDKEDVAVQFAFEGIGFDRAKDLLFNSLAIVGPLTIEERLYSGDYFYQPDEEAVDLLDLREATLQAAQQLGFSYWELDQLYRSWAAIGLPLQEHDRPCLIDWGTKWRCFQEGTTGNPADVLVSDNIVIAAGGSMDFSAIGDMMQNKVHFAPGVSIDVLAGAGLKLEKIRLLPQAGQSSWGGIRFIGWSDSELQEWLTEHPDFVIEGAQVRTVDSGILAEGGIFDGIVEVSGDVILGAGQSLDLSNSEVSFENGAGLIVEPGARLVLDNTVLTSCRDGWKGIEIRANKSTGQVGELIMRNQSQISKADIAVLLPAEYPGGHFDIEQSSILNCRKGILMQDNMDTVNFSESQVRQTSFEEVETAVELENVSIRPIISNSFLNTSTGIKATNSQILVGGEVEGLGNYFEKAKNGIIKGRDLECACFPPEYPNSRIIGNEFLAVTSAIALDAGTEDEILSNDIYLHKDDIQESRGLLAIDSRDLLVRDNLITIQGIQPELEEMQYNHAALQESFTGMILANTSASIVENRLINLQKGIDVYNVHSLSHASIKTNQLYHVLKGITMNTSPHFSVAHNTIIDIPKGNELIGLDSYGLWVQDCSGFEIWDNTFTTNDHLDVRGLIIDNSNFNETYSGSTVFDNTFEGPFTAAVRFEGDNGIPSAAGPGAMGLQLYCNEHFDCQIDWHIAPNAILAPQGNEIWDGGMIRPFTQLWTDPNAELFSLHVWNEGLQAVLLVCGGEDEPIVYEGDVSFGEPDVLYNQVACIDITLGLEENITGGDCTEVQSSSDPLDAKTQREISSLLRDNLEEGRTECAEQVLEAQDAKWADWVLVGTQLSAGEYQKADETMEEIDKSLESDEVLEVFYRAVIDGQVSGSNKIDLLRMQSSAPSSPSSKRSMKTLVESAEAMIMAKTVTRSINTTAKAESAQQRPLQSLWKVSPNPANDIVHVSIATESIATVRSVEIFDLQGKLIISEEWGTNDMRNLDIDVSALNSGLYICQLKTEKECSSLRIAIQ